MESLSTLIRRGVEKRPFQIFGRRIGLLSNGDTGTDAIGAALESAGYDLAADPDPSHQNIYQVLEIEPMRVKSPVQSERKQDLIDEIDDLGDVHRWSREAIANWLEWIDL